MSKSRYPASTRRQLGLCQAATGNWLRVGAAGNGALGVEVNGHENTNRNHEVIIMMLIGLQVSPLGYISVWRELHRLYGMWGFP